MRREVVNWELEYGAEKDSCVNSGFFSFGVSWKQEAYRVLIFEIRIAHQKVN